MVSFQIGPAGMGSQIKLKTAPEIRWRVEPQGKIERIDIIRDGRVVHSAADKSGKWIDKAVSAGRHWYYLRVKEQGLHRKYPHNVAPAWGKWAWSSPIWSEIEI